MDRKNHKKKRIIVTNLTVVVLVVLTLLAVFLQKTAVIAKATLPGIETIVMNNSNASPYVILEVVPNKSEAKLGFLVGGEEPVSNGKSIKDMPSAAERIDLIGKFAGMPVNIDAMVSFSQYEEKSTGTEGALTTQIRGSFKEAQNGDYQHNDENKLYEYKDKQNIDDTDKLYMKFASYRKPDSGAGEYKVDLMKADSMPQKVATEVEEHAYNYQYFVASSFEKLEDTNVGDVIYLTDDESNVNNLTYLGMVFDGEEGKYIKKEDSNPDVNTEGYSNYRIVREAQGGDEALQKYCISSITKGSSLPYAKTVDYKEAEKNDDNTYPQGFDYFVKKSGKEYSYEESGAGNSVFTADYTKDIVDTATYSGGFQNEEWLKKYVFDREDTEECENLVIDVVPITIDELNSYDLTKANLVYFAGGQTSYLDDSNNHLLSEEKAQEIVKEVVNNNLPIIFNRSTEVQNANNPNLMKLALCLRQKDYTALNMSELVTNWGDPSWNTALLQNEKEDISTSEHGSYVNKSVFIYDDISTGTTPLIYEDFITEITDKQKLDYGFSDILKEIEQENFYLSVAGKTERISNTISKATAFRYIVNYGNKRTVVKSKINILDLEPGDKSPYSDNTISTYNDGDVKSIWNGTNKVVASSYVDETFSKDWFIKNIGTQFTENKNAIAINLMGTKEFIGNLDDLNENYDMIYVGLDTSILNTNLDNNKKTNQTIYNDSDMNDLVYSHIGDRIETTGEVNGTYRLPGNDITFDKLNEIKEYMRAGYAILFADGFFIKDANDQWEVNNDKIDKSSNMYELANEALKKEDGAYVYYGKNAMIQEELDGTSNEAALRRENFVKYLNISKLSVTYDQVPLAYNDNGTQHYLTPDNSGICSLNYEVSLKNDAAVELIDTSYDCLLYFDLDADGKFEKNEIQSGLSIINSTNDSASEYTDDSSKYNLKTGNTYKISKQLPEDYTGLLSWKIVFVQNDGTELIRTAKTGFSAVEAKGEKPTIKVLQISSNNTTNGGNLDLKNDTQMKQLYSQVKDFTVDVTQMSANSFVSKSGFSDYFSYLCKFDMVVMGFADSYTLGGNSDACKNAILGIREYVLSGRSILFTHDLNSFTQSENQKNGWGYYANMYLRDVQGMDRFGTLSSSTLIPNEDRYKYDSQYDKKVNLPVSGDTAGGISETMAYTSSNSIRYHSDTVKYGENSRYSSFHFDPHSTTDGKNFDRTVVSAVNHGQITEYPFHIDDMFNVQHTHAQYYQLNLDTNSDDENVNDDVVVWYTISGLYNTEDSFYKASKNDVRNNYYIYNKGNVTYTGCGDKQLGSGVLMEKELFVNTLVAAYNAGVHAPKVIYKENKTNNSAEIANLYVPYDSTISGSGSYLNNEITVNFKTLNINMVNNARKLFTKYYVESTAGDYKIRIGNLYLREVAPVTGSLNKMVTDGTNLIEQPVADPYKLDNYSLYTMKLNVNADSIGLIDKESIASKNGVNLYIRIGYEKLSENSMETEPATESLNKLTLVKTDLFELE